jgi:membrane protease YdiL (CAAX protease family)
MKNKNLIFVLSLIFLFALYHLAEYFIVFKNNAGMFLAFQLLFFGIAFLLGKWYENGGLSTWGFSIKGDFLSQIIWGIIFGVLLYGIPYLIGISFGIEKITEIPNVNTIVKTSLPFVFGLIFSSTSEDILTRGLLFRHLHSKIGSVLFVLLSAVFYVLNHIYKLGNGFETLAYLFLLGVIFAIPILVTKKLWVTSAMHWVGNCVFYITHEVIKTQEIPSKIGFNTILCLFILVTVFVFILLKDRLFAPKTEI